MFASGSYIDDHVEVEVKDHHEVGRLMHPKLLYERRTTCHDQAALGSAMTIVVEAERQVVLKTTLLFEGRLTKYQVRALAKAVLVPASIVQDDHRSIWKVQILGHQYLFFAEHTLAEHQSGSGDECEQQEIVAGSTEVQSGH